MGQLQCAEISDKSAQRDASRADNCKVPSSFYLARRLVTAPDMYTCTPRTGRFLVAIDSLTRMYVRYDTPSGISINSRLCRLWVQMRYIVYIIRSYVSHVSYPKIDALLFVSLVHIIPAENNGGNTVLIVYT